MQQEPSHFERSAPSAPSPLPRTAAIQSASPREKCQILAKKGFLVAKNVTSGLVLLIYSAEFQLGVLIHLPVASGPASVGADAQHQAFTKSAMALILSEFESLGVSRSRLLTYVIGGSATDAAPEISKLTVQRTLWSYGLPLSASDLGGQLLRSIWMDVENGRTIVRSEPLPSSHLSIHSPLKAAS
jgi:chemotaxis receptor (MCP) glutamine deamidase CheD